MLPIKNGSILMDVKVVVNATTIIIIICCIVAEELHVCDLKNQGHCACAAHHTHAAIVHFSSSLSSS